ncbi:MAG: hypothetical protein M1819_004343 [Sarea resinae]|nr:MAG: hypothetical protein M1819_004343 [Sarea resinae]
MERSPPSSEYKEIAAQFAQAKALKQKDEAAGKSLSDQRKKLNEHKALQFKASHGLLIGLFSWLLFLHVVGIYFFTKGFLLTRLVLDRKSQCDVPPSLSEPVNAPIASDDGCWHPKTFDKAVVIIVDALRYDFTVPFRPSNELEAPHHFHNALPFFYETATEQPNNAFLLPFIADPPTTTLQRLKGLTTGTLPTFIDAGSNFAGTAIEEDNLIAQLRDAGKTLVQLGDDTWNSLFPGYFDVNLTHAYDSFNVWDLHTVDNGVSEHLLPLLNPVNSSKWDVVFGHYLGVDHAGHRYGPDHPAMTAKLQQMDRTFREIVELLDDDTLLVVMGDHGMDAKGDHGGESDDEIEAALWMYSKKGIFGRSDPAFVEPPSNAKERPVAQIDLVPTLSLLLGLPIPFNNLGAPIEEAFVGKSGQDWRNLAIVNRLAGAQVMRYQNEYANARGLEAEPTSGPLALWNGATFQWETASNSKKANDEKWKDAYVAFSKYQKETLSIYRSLWARFDVPSMGFGIGLLFVGVVLLAAYARGIRGDAIALTPFLLIRIFIGSCIGAAVGTLSGLALPQVAIVSAGLYGTAMGGVFGAISIATFQRKIFSLPFPNSIWGWAAVLFTVAQSVGFASNSYTIWEDQMLLFFLATFGALGLASSLRQKSVTDRALGSYHSVLFMVLGRVASFSRLCREEQMPYCRSTYYASSTSSTSAPWQLAIPFVVTLLLPSVIRSYYNGTKSYEGPATFWIGFAFRVGLLLSAIFWVLDAADDGDWFASNTTALKTARTLIAQLVLAIALAAGSTTFAWATPCVNIEASNENDAVAPSPKTLKTPAVPSTTTTTTTTTATPGTGRSITILGYANVHGSRYALLLTNYLLAGILVQKPMGSGALALLAWQIFSLLEVVDTSDLSRSAIGPVVLAMLGSFHYFTTGHQATLASIQWEAAFVPLKTVRYPWSPLLVVLNTFGAHILAAVAVPLLVLWKQPPGGGGGGGGGRSLTTTPSQPSHSSHSSHLLSDVAKATATFLLYFATVNLATTAWAAWLRRHLMLYRIFSPRFMLGGVVLVVVDLVAVFVGLVGVRWSFLSVGEVFGWA